MQEIHRFVEIKVVEDVSFITYLIQNINLCLHPLFPIVNQDFIMPKIYDKSSLSVFSFTYKFTNRIDLYRKLDCLNFEQGKSHSQFFIA